MITDAERDTLLVILLKLSESKCTPIKRCANSLFTLLTKEKYTE